MLQNLKALGNSYTDESSGAVLTLHRSRPLRAYRVQSELAEMTSSFIDFNVCKDRFLVAECFLLQLENVSPDHPLSIYLNNRSGLTTLERFELFEMITDKPVFDLLGEAYTQTRQIEYPLPSEAPEDTQEKKSG